MDSSNTFKNMSPDLKDAYSKKKRFKKLKNSITKKATAELEASKDPMGYLDKMTDADIRKVKGVAF